MAAALGVAATAPASEALAIFLALALGFAAPFMLLGFSPSALRLLPRPGPWMVTFRQFLAFPMYGAAAWLVWVLSQQVGADGMFAMLGAALALAFALWAYGLSEHSKGTGHRWSLSFATLGALAMVLLTVRVGESKPLAALPTQTASALAYQPYSAARLADLRSRGKPVFVDATAAWCITCLVNERVALSSANLARAFEDSGIVALKADWTNQNPEITSLLSEFGRSGVPLYLYFPPNGGDPVVLPQLLTESTVLSAIAQRPGTSG
jgi:thiol:disulfide interchange protein DsbD